MSDISLATLTDPGVRRWQLTPGIRLTSVEATLAADLELRSENDAHLSLVMLAEGAGWFRFNRQQAQPYSGNGCWLFCASSRCPAYDFFPRHHACRLLILDFAADFLPRVQACGLLSAGTAARVFSATLAEPLKRVMLHIQRAWNETSPLAALQIESLALNALWLTLEQLQSMQTPRVLAADTRLPESDRLRLTAAREVISLQACEALSITEIARTAGLSLMTFKRGFRAMFGVTPWNYVIECRLKRARQLLEESALPLNEIALRSGFAHASHLTRFFQRQYGQPPGRYRSHYQQLWLAD